MPVLLTSPASPFGRKVKIALSVCGLYDSVRIQLANTTDPADALQDHNPLGKIPALVLDDGSAIFDSRVIAEWADITAGGNRIIPADGTRIAVLTTQALADGIIDACLAIVYEKRFRPEDKWVPSWMDRQAGKIEKGLTAFEAATPLLSDVPDIGAIALACALGYRDLRFDPKWRQTWPGLADWLSEFERLVPAYAKTGPEIS